jgi:hypothetical protein
MDLHFLLLNSVTECTKINITPERRFSYCYLKHSREPLIGGDYGCLVLVARCSMDRNLGWSGGCGDVDPGEERRKDI